MTTLTYGMYLSATNARVSCLGPSLDNDDTGGDKTAMLVHTIDKRLSTQTTHIFQSSKLNQNGQSPF